MGFFNLLFSGNKTKTLDEAIEEIEETRLRLDKRLVDAEEEIRKFTEKAKREIQRGNKASAIFALKIKKIYEDYAETLAAQSFSLSQQTSNLSSAANHGLVHQTDIVVSDDLRRNRLELKEVLQLIAAQQEQSYAIDRLGEVHLDGGEPFEEELERLAAAETSTSAISEMLGELHLDGGEPFEEELERLAAAETSTSAIPERLAAELETSTYAIPERLAAELETSTYAIPERLATNAETRDAAIPAHLQRDRSNSDNYFRRILKKGRETHDGPVSSSSGFIVQKLLESNSGRTKLVRTENEDC